MAQSVHLVIIDPQVDFMDLTGSSLPVAGANDDMNRLAAFVDRAGSKLDDIHVTLDSHRVIDVGHPAMWVNDKGEHPAPFTMITSADLESGIWKPRNGFLKPGVLGGLTIRDYFIGYAKALEAKGQYVLMVWPEHCLIGSPGHAIQPTLLASLQAWEKREYATVGFVTKGTSPWTECYGALEAEVPLPADPSTGLNTGFLNILQTADMIAIAGEALSHCVLSTVNQIADNFGDALLGKFYLLTDAMSPVGQAPGGPDFPAIGAKWLKDMEARGMHLTTTTEFLA